MKLMRYIAFPIVPIYYFVTWLRNKLYDSGIKSSKSYSLPLICVGNLSAGGTGKTPMVEYLIRLLKDDYVLATLSRGYGRKTKGYVLGTSSSSAVTLGDEPFQFYNAFSKDIKVAVDGDRQNGIKNLLNLKPPPEIILLDDAFQHRKVKADFNVLLTTYSNLYTDDWVLPTGNLREPRTGAKRAQIIVITKCPAILSEAEKEKIINKINPEIHQQVFFSKIGYSNAVVSENKKIELKTLPQFTLVTGIANAKPLVDFLKLNNLDFNHLEYKDHHQFTENDIKTIEKSEFVLTTEKDYMRLKDFSSLKNKLYYLPIQTEIDNALGFDSLIKQFVINYAS